MKNLIFTSIFIFAILFSCTQRRIGLDQSFSTQVGNNSVKIEYNDNWSLDTVTGNNRTLLALVNHRKNKENFRPNINIIAQQVDKGYYDLESFTAYSIEQLNENLPNVHFVQNKDKIIAGDTLKVLKFTSETPEINLMYEQRYLLKNQQYFVLTFVAKMNQFNEAEKEAEAIMDSFRVE